MSESTGVTCRNCRAKYFPDLGAKGPWICTACRAKNTNLKRHYRFIAIIFILGVIREFLSETLILTLFLRGAPGLAGWSLLYGACRVALWVIASVLIYRSKEPWNDKTVKALTWIGGLYLGLWVGWALGFVYVLVFLVIATGYLIWLHIQTKRALG